MKKKLYQISIGLFLLDQISKILVMKNLPYQVSQVLIPNFFSLTYTKNTGGAFSILSGNVLFLGVIGLIVLACFIYYIEKHPPKTWLETVSSAFVLGGLLGNLFDRIVRDGVIDFLDFQIFSYPFPVFNIADIAIVLGIFTIIILEMRGEKNDSNQRKCSSRSIFKRNTRNF